MPRLRNGIAALVTFVLTVGAAPTLAAPSNASTDAPRPPAIWFTPHQDDETLSMGAAIRLSVLGGRRNIVVLCTDGGASAVARQYPDRASFVAERDREFKAAVKALGARAVISPRRVPDGTLTVKSATRIMRPYFAKHPEARFNTMSWTEPHPDHAALGRALQAAPVRHTRYFIQPRQWPVVPGTFTRQVDIRSALLAYDPVGWLSSPKAFDSQLDGARSKSHD